MATGAPTRRGELEPVVGPADRREPEQREEPEIYPIHTDIREEEGGDEDRADDEHAGRLRGRVGRRVKETFSEIDRNGNNLLDKREFEEAMRVLKADIDRDDLDTLFDYFDADHNGGLDYTEFVRLLGFEERRY